MTGEKLQEFLESPIVQPTPLVEDFLYERTTFMITGEAGKGKSVIASQLLASMSTNECPLFGSLLIPKPRRTYYLQLEGSPEMFGTRLKYQRQVIPINPKNIYWDRDVRFNAANSEKFKAKLKQIKDFGPDTVEIDPIYKCVAGDIAQATFSLALIHFFEAIEETCRCTLLLFHHPHREKYTITGRKIEEKDSFYGHSFIRNHIETAFVFRQTSQDGEESELVHTKIREENIHPQISLTYHPETYTCSMLPMHKEKSKRETVISFLISRLEKGQPTTFKEIKTACHVSATFLRNLQSEFKQRNLVAFTIRDGTPTVWIPLAALKQSTFS